MSIIKKLKSDIVKGIEDFMETNLVNHRKKDAGLISMHNTLIRDVKKFLNEWKKQRWLENECGTSNENDWWGIIERIS